MQAQLAKIEKLAKQVLAAHQAEAADATQRLKAEVLATQAAQTAAKRKVKKAESTLQSLSNARAAADSAALRRAEERASEELTKASWALKTAELSCAKASETHRTKFQHLNELADLVPRLASFVTPPHAGSGLRTLLAHVEAALQTATESRPAINGAANVLVDANYELKRAREAAQATETALTHIREASSRSKLREVLKALATTQAEAERTREALRAARSAAATARRQWRSAMGEVMVCYRLHQAIISLIPVADKLDKERRDQQYAQEAAEREARARRQEEEWRLQREREERERRYDRSDTSSSCGCTEFYRCDSCRLAQNGHRDTSWDMTR